MKRGFTLVELSIVLVIIGLLIGGILAAQSMISTAKVQRLIRNLKQYEIAINNFKTNYKYYPGDSPSFTPAGNKDNAVDGLSGCIGIYRNYEPDQVFGHLSQANMLSGNYVPYSPIMCGGTQNNVDNSPDLVGIIAPYTEVDSTAAAYSGGSRKINLWALKGAATNFLLGFYVSAGDVIPLESKIGYLTGSNACCGTSGGLFNLSGLGPGYCTGSTSLVYCTDPLAVYGLFYFYLAPI